MEVTAGLDALITVDGKSSGTVLEFDDTVAQGDWRSKLIACETSGSVEASQAPALAGFLSQLNAG